MVVIFVKGVFYKLIILYFIHGFNKFAQEIELGYLPSNQQLGVQQIFIKTVFVAHGLALNPVNTHTYLTFRLNFRLNSLLKKFLCQCTQEVQ